MLEKSKYQQKNCVLKKTGRETTIKHWLLNGNYVSSLEVKAGSWSKIKEAKKNM